MDNSPDNPLKILEEKFPWVPKLFSEKKLLWILAGFLILAGTFSNISSGSAIVIGLGIILIILALIDPKTIKKLSSKWFSIERHKYSEEERQTAAQAGQKDVPPEIKQKLTRIIVDAGKRKDAERAPEDYLVLANQAWEEKKYENGLGLAYSGLRLAPKDPRTRAGLYNIIGIIYSNLKSHSLSEKNYRKAIQIDDTFSLFHYNLGNLYADQKKYDLAEAEYKKALELDPKDADAYCNLGALYSEQKKYELAEAALNKALELGPELKEVQENLKELRKLRSEGEDSPAHPTLDLGEARSKKFP